MKLEKLISQKSLSCVFLLTLISSLSYADDIKDIKDNDTSAGFVDIVKDKSSGINYRRTESLRDAILDQYKLPGSILGFMDVPMTPGQSRGNPGVALFDYDNDGDLDIYVTNGPGTANSLYSNQSSDTTDEKKDNAKVHFLDVAIKAGVAATDQDSNGVCFGDIDNDGDKDLYVMGASEPNKLFENLGDGHFEDITYQSQTSTGDKNSITCSFGDVNGDGLLDLVVGNLYNNFDNRLALMVESFEHLKEHNNLLINQGGNVFKDESVSSGVQDFRGASWSIAMVDYDKDGDIDIFIADDQATRLPAKVGGVDVGYIRILNNDGLGHFTDVTEAAGMNIVGDWMGITFADFNADGYLDLFATNIGDYLAAAVGSTVGLPTGKNEWSSRWFLGQADGTFTDPGIGSLGTTPFGWGASAADYDNDGDQDIIFHGGADMGILVDATNPGVILNNDGLANFKRDKTSLSNSSSHARRNVQGVAMGDLNNDGLADIVSVSSMDWPDAFPLAPIINPENNFGGEFDDSAYIWPTFAPVDPLNPLSGFVWTGLEPEDGTLSVEINNLDNDNNWIKVKLLGTKGLTSGGQSNRDGIGAVVTFTPKNGKPSTKAVVSGGSNASADELSLIFGLPNTEKGSLEVLWPGGVKNRLNITHANKMYVVPEIPCDFNSHWNNKNEYVNCVRNSLNELSSLGIVEKSQYRRIFRSAITAYKQKKVY